MFFSSHFFFFFYFERIWEESRSLLWLQKPHDARKKFWRHIWNSFGGIINHADVNSFRSFFLSFVLYFFLIYFSIKFLFTHSIISFLFHFSALNCSLRCGIFLRDRKLMMCNIMLLWLFILEDRYRCKYYILIAVVQFLDLIYLTSHCCLCSSDPTMCRTSPCGHERLFQRTSLSRAVLHVTDGRCARRCSVFDVFRRFTSRPSVSVCWCRRIHLRQQCLPSLWYYHHCCHSYFLTVAAIGVTIRLSH